LQTLDETTVQRIKECKRHGFPICLEEALLHIFQEREAELLISRSTEKLKLGPKLIQSANQIFTIYDEMLLGFDEDLGKDVSQVVEFQSLKEMELMKGCMSCPLYQRRTNKMDSL
jgi:hypothetical protein